MRELKSNCINYFSVKRILSIFIIETNFHEKKLYSTIKDLYKKLVNISPKALRYDKQVQITKFTIIQVYAKIVHKN